MKLVSLHTKLDDDPYYEVRRKIYTLKARYFIETNIGDKVYRNVFYSGIIQEMLYSREI